MILSIDTRRISIRFLAGFFFVTLLMLAPVRLSGAATTLQLGISPPGGANELTPSAFLTWNAQPGSVYKVQSGTTLDAATSWATEDAVLATGTTASWTAPAGIQQTMYYRLVLPQETIFTVEPAVVAPGVAVDLYIVGQLFGSNDVLLINGVPQTNAVFQSSTLAVNPSFVPDVPGTYQLKLVVRGQVVSSFNVTCADALTDPELVLQGPPLGTPASPSTLPTAQFLEGDPDRPIIAGRSYNGMGAGKITLNPFSIMKKIDMASPTFFNGFTAGISGGGEELPKESLEFNYGRASKLAPEKAEAGSEYVRKNGAVIAADYNYNEKGRCVAAFSGEVQECDLDMAIPGRGLAFVWARFYHSRTGHLITLDDRWTFSYDVHCAQNSTVGLDVFDGTGRKDTFKPQTNGVYTCPEFFREGTVSNNTFTLTFADTGRWVFNPFDGTATAGKLIKIITRNGDTMTLGYDTSGRLAQVVDDLNRTNTMSYNSSGQLASVTDFSGRTVTYAYYSGETGGSLGDLKSVTSPPVTGTPNGNDFPLGKTVTYTYSTGYTNDAENHLLLSVTDAKGQTAAVFTYEHSATDPANYLHCITAQEGRNPPSCYHWTLVSRPAGSYATLKCIANDPVGNVTESFFDARNRCVIEDDYTGRATPGLPVTDTVNRPAGKLRSSDPDYYEMRAEWNNDSLCTKLYLFGGQQVQCLYQSDFDSFTTARKRADCRVVRELATGPVDLDGDGAPDVSDRAWHYSYDPRFGSDSTARDYCVQYRETPFEFAAYVSPNTGKAMGIMWSGSGSGGDSPRESLSATIPYTPSNPYNPATRLGQPGGNGADANTAAARGKRYRRVLLQQGRLMQSGCAWRYIPVRRMAVFLRARRLGYEPDPGLAAASKGWDGTIKGLVVPDGNGMAIKTKGTGADKNRTSAPGGVWRLDPTDFTKDYNVLSFAERDYDCDGFVSSVTDPRGNVTTGTYDANGNRVKVKFYWDRQSSAERDFAYDTHGQLTVITNLPDANGHSRVDMFSYYTNSPQAGYLQQCVVDAGGLAIAEGYEYDPRGNLTRCIDPRTNDWLFTYNSLDQLVQSSSASLSVNGSLGTYRIAAQYAYDANDNLVQCATDLRDAAGNLLGGKTNRFQYDPIDRLSEIALAVDATHARTNRFTYDGNGECVQVLGGDAVSGADPHQIIAYQYDERGLLFREIAAPGAILAGTNEYSYTANYNPATKKYVDDNGSMKVDFTYDGLDRLASVSDPMGNQTVCFFDVNDNPKVVRLFGETNDVPGSAGNVRLAESHYEYDGRNRCVHTHDLFFDIATQSPLGSGEALTTFAYAPNDDCVSITDTLGHASTFGYDTACRPVSVTDALGNQRSVVYDACSNPLNEISAELPAGGGKPQVFSVTNVYDALNRWVSITDSAGNTGSCAYDSLDRCVQTVDPRGTQAFFSYDLLDRRTVAIGDLDRDGLADFARDITTTFNWSSSSGNLLAMTDSHTNMTSYAYDSLGRCTRITSADGTRHTFAWNARSDLGSEQDANGTVVLHTYDLNDRCISNSITAGPGVSSRTTFEQFQYDGLSRCTRQKDDDCDGFFAYDSLDDCTRETLNGLVTASTYDARGNRLSLIYPGGRALAYSYDALNRCASINGSGQQLAGYAYDGLDRVSLINYGNGTRTQIAYDGFAGTPNAASDYGFGQVSRVRHGFPAKGVVIDDRTFSFDPDQNKTTRDMTSPFTLGGAAQAQAFQYDAACRLVNSLVTTNGAVARLVSYGLDRMGNRTNVTGAACSGPYTMSSVVPPGDFQLNQYTTTPCDMRSYDGDGNLTNRSSAVGPVTYQYDYAGRLVLVQALDSGTGAVAPLAGYVYDALGRRISKTVYSRGLPPATTQFLYDGENVVEERAGGTVTATFVLDGTRSHDSQVVRLFSMSRGGKDYFYHADDLGNVLALTDATGAVAERYDYDDYGAVTFLGVDGTPTGATSSFVGNVYCWGGLRLDTETGLHNDDGGGYFEPQSGRAIRGKVKVVKIDTLSFAGNNPWAGGTPNAKETVWGDTTVWGISTVMGNNPWSGGGGGGGGALATETVVFRPSRGEIK
jgi:YD repeat-containing protein